VVLDLLRLLLRYVTVSPILGSDNIFSSRKLSHLLWIPSSLLFDEYQELISRAKAEREVDRLPASVAEDDNQL